MNIAYVRVSSTEQDQTKQIEALKKNNIKKWFIEKQSNNSSDRFQLQDLLEFVKEGDTIYIQNFNIIAKSTSELLSLIKQLDKRKISLVSIKENINSSSEKGKIMISMISDIADFERNTILERQKDGIEIAKREGKYVGRQPVKVNKKEFDEKYDNYMSRKITKLKFANSIGIARPTLDKIIKAYETDTISECNGYYYVEATKDYKGVQT